MWGLEVGESQISSGFLEIAVIVGLLWNIRWNARPFGSFWTWSYLSIAIQRIFFLQGNRGGYDMGQRPSHVGHLPQQPLGSSGRYEDETRFFHVAGHPIQQQIHQNPSWEAIIMTWTNQIQFGDSKNPVTLSHYFPRTILVMQGWED